MSAASGGPSNADSSIGSLVALAQQGDHAGVISLWQHLPEPLLRREIVARIAASAFAQLGDLGRAAQVLGTLMASVKVVEAPTYALAGRIAFDRQQFADSVHALEQALALSPEARWWLWLADASIKAGQPGRALAWSSHFEPLAQQHADVAITQATLLAHAGRSHEARQCFERILARWPRHEVAGPGYAEFVMREFPLEAAQLLRQAPWRPAWNELSPARVRAALWLPAFYLDEDSAAGWRARLRADLHDLTEAARRSPLRGDDRAACLATTPFFVAFHEADVTEIQFAWGDFVEAVVAPLRAELGLPLEPSSRIVRPVRRIGIVSNRITNSSAGRFFNGWIDELAAAGFEVRLYAFGNTDQVTSAFGARFALRHFAQDDSMHWRVAAEALRDDDNDALLFPEPQGSQLLSLLAGLKLAPIQCAAFGNPLTTGLQTMDYFLSPDAAEVAQPSSHYRERVIRLAGMGTRVLADLPDALPMVTKEALGLKANDRLYLVSQQMQKWSPTFVQLLAEILKRDSHGQVVHFDIGGAISGDAFRRFLQDALGNFGIDATERVKRLAAVARPQFLAINQCADVALDTVSFGGGSTTFDALSVGLPVASLCGSFLRSRQTHAMLQLCGQASLSAIDRAAYVRIAVEQANAPRDRRERRDGPLTFPSGAAAAAADPDAAVFASATDFFSSLR